MAKQIHFTFEDREYTLMYTRNSVRTMERQGFVADDITTKPMTVLPALFAGAFIAKHPGIKQERINKIYDQMTDKRSLIAALSTMYNETIETLLETRDDAGNVAWTPNWQIETEDE